MIAAAMMVIYADYHWHEMRVGGPSTALLLRLGSIAVDVTLLTFLGSKAVKEFFGGQSHARTRGFDVIVADRSG